jgi:antitoxin ParD1/3/4
MSKHTMNVSLTPELEEIVLTYIQKGMYGNQSEVFRAALRLLHEQEQEREARLAALRSDVRFGLKEVIAGVGDYVPAEAFKARGRKRLRDQG